MNPIASRLSVFMGTASLFTIASVIAAQAQNQQVVQAAQAAPEALPEQVLITGSLIRGTAAVGVPVTSLGLQDFQTTGSVKIGDLFRNLPSIQIPTDADAINNGGHKTRLVGINIHGLDNNRAPRSLMMVDGVRFPIQGDHLNSHDPSVIPALALDRIDVLVDGASATYGSDALTGVVNIILRRGYDGAVSQLGFSAQEGKQHFLASQLWGRTWDGGGVTITYEWYDDSPLMGTVHSNFTSDFRPWGLTDQTPAGSSLPATVSVGAPVNTANGLNASLGNNCTNCFAVPEGSGANFNSLLNGGLGPLTQASASGIPTWAQIQANSGVNGTRNVFDPLKMGWEASAQQRNAATITLDQRLTRNISFYGEAFYSNRRGQILVPSSAKPNNTLIQSGIGIPTWNPYYPSGAPSGLRVNYNLALEIPAVTHVAEVAGRYMGGFNIDLPFDWHGNIYYSNTFDGSISISPGQANRAAVSAALGWTIGVTAATGTTPAVATWTKPATVPYLNLFCDPRQFECNSPTTLNYVKGLLLEDENYAINEKGVNFDGPLFDLPAGTVRAAIGGTYTKYVFKNLLLNNSGAPTLLIQPVYAFNPTTVWAGFAQLNVPIFSDTFNVPLARRLDLEIAWRHDQYNLDLKGGTSNPKVGFTWVLSEDAGLSVKGSWNSAFRFPSPGEYSAQYVNNIQAFNLPANLSLPGNAITIACTGGKPAAGSAAEALFNALGPSSCGQSFGGISAGGGPLASLRPNGFNGGPFLRPEKSINYVIGAEFAPSGFLSGLDLQASWYSIKVSDVLDAHGAAQTSFNDPTQRFSYVIPTDLVSQPGGAACATANATPAACAPFQDMVRSVLFNTNNASAQPAAQTLIFWVNDGGVINHGTQLATGIDWTASYDWDWGDLGAWNVGVVGTYYLHNYLQGGPGEDKVDTWHETLSSIGGLPVEGVTEIPRMNYRARLGWSNGTWDVTGFMNYTAHHHSTASAPSNVNNQCATAGGTLPRGTFPCALQGYSGLIPSTYLFDVSIGYDTGDAPTNDYLKHLQVNFVVNNVLGRRPPFSFDPGNGGHTPTAYDQQKSNNGRIFHLIVTKTW